MQRGAAAGVAGGCGSASRQCPTGRSSGLRLRAHAPLDRLPLRKSGPAVRVARVGWGRRTSSSATRRPSVKLASSARSPAPS
eukprot:3416728-Prymnesium_polylepis.2